MEKRVLGRTGLWVSTIGVGAGQFGAFGQTTEDVCIRIAHCALDGGVNLIDTADFYSMGESETIVGKAIAGRRDKVVVATKCGMAVSDDPGERGASRSWIIRSVENSLKRLNTDYIDLYQIHRPDPNTDIEETLRALNDLVTGGKIRYFGNSNFPAEHLVEAQLRAEMRGLTGFHSAQPSYSILNRRIEADVLPVCERFGMGVLAYSPLESGWLSGKYRRGRSVEPSPRHRLQPHVFDLQADYNQRKLDAVEQLAGIAADAGLDLSHMAIAAVLSHRAVTSALVGGGKVEYIEKHLKSQDLRLSEETLDKIDAVVPPGSSIHPSQSSSPALQDKSLRRRPVASGQQTAEGADFIRRAVSDEKAS